MKRKPPPRGYRREKRADIPAADRKVAPRGYRRRFPADIPAASRKNAAARVQERKTRGYTRNQPKKRRRAGTGEDFPRIYPQEAGKTPPRGYRRKNRADIPATGQKSSAARVQEKISRGYTRNWPEKHRRAGTGEDFPRIYPTTSRNISPRELYYTYSLRKRTTRVPSTNRVRKCTTRVSLTKPADISHPRLFAHAGA